MSSNFDKLEILGSGTFGKVWLARNVRSKKIVVVKEVETRGFTPSEREQALNEVAILGRCRHVNIIRYREAFVDGSTLNIVMEHADDGDLYQKIQKARWTYLSNESILDWFVQICYALRHIHGLNILHRDLKTKNIFVTSRNIIKVGDFGIARMLTGTDAHAQTTIGTPYYISPEICQKMPYNHKSDMWALGCVLYELCCLDHPFVGSDIASIVVRILDGRYKSIPRHCGAVLEDLVCILLRADADSRPSADQILCIPALRNYVQSYVRRMTGEKGLPGTPRPQSCRSSLSDASPVLSPTEITPKEGVTPDSLSPQDTSPPNRKRKYEPRNPSPLTFKEDAASQQQQQLCPILQLCVRHPNIPSFKQFLQKKNIAIPSQTGKENITRREVGCKVLPAVKISDQESPDRPRALLGRTKSLSSSTSSSTSSSPVENMVKKQKRVIRSAEAIRQAKVTIKNKHKLSPRATLYKEVLRRTPFGALVVNKQCGDGGALATVTSDPSALEKMVAAEQYQMIPEDGEDQENEEVFTAEEPENVATKAEISAALQSSICLNQNEAFSKLEALRDFLEKSLGGECLMRMRDTMKDRLLSAKFKAPADEIVDREYLPLLLQLIQLESMTGS